MESVSKIYELNVVRNGLSTEIANQLCERIRKERMPEGTVLGTEAVLAKQYGVSRTVIRESIGQLRGLGIVESRQGLGLCVNHGDALDKIGKILAPVAGEKASWSRLCHMRFVLEVGTIPLAVEFITNDQIEKLRQLAAEMIDLLGDGQSISRETEAKIAQMEVEFHDLIMKAGQCEFTQQFHSILVEYFNESSLDGPYRKLPTQKDMQDHVKLVEAIAERDMEKSTSIMVDHIRDILNED